MPRRLTLITTLAFASTAALAQDPLKTLPNNYSLALDNSEIEVIRAHYGPHEKIPVHDHSSLGTVFVYLSDSGEVRINHAEAGEKAFSILRPPTVKGAFRVNNGMAETHSIENLGDTPSDFLRVELKHVVLHLQTSFRGPAPASLTTSQTATEFSQPDLQIERIVCTSVPSCPVVPSPTPSLLIAFTTQRIATGENSQSQPLPAGNVLWLASGQAATITPSASMPAHLLRILLPSAPR